MARLRVRLDKGRESRKIDCAISRFATESHYKFRAPLGREVCIYMHSVKQ